MITIAPIVEVSLPHRAFFVEASASGHVVAASAEGRVSVLGPDLVLVAQLDAGRELGDLAISPAGDRLALGGNGSLSLVRSTDGHEEWSAPVGPSSASGFDHGGALLWTLDLEDEERFIVRLRNTGDGRVLREGRFASPSADAQCSFHALPRAGAIAIWVAAGQDGQWIFHAHDSGEVITITPIGGIAECAPPCFDENGGAFLTTTFDGVSSWSFPEGSCTRTVREWPWGESGDDAVGSSVVWVGSRGALVTTNENRMYLVDLERGAVVDEVVVDGHPLRPIGELHPALAGEAGLTSDVERVIPVGAGRVVTVGGDPACARLVLTDTTVLRAARFWSWFASNEERFRSVIGLEQDQLLDELLSHLQDFSPRLYFQLGGAATRGPTELIVTAEGDAASFPAVATLVDAAPTLPGWRFIAFMPPAGFAFVTDHEGVRVDPAECWFIPMVSATDPTSLALSVAVPSYDAAKEDAFRFAVRVVLQTGLGELAYASAIDFFEVEALPVSPEAAGYIELPDLARYLEYHARKTARLH